MKVFGGRKGRPPFELGESQLRTAINLVVDASRIARDDPPIRRNERRLCRRIYMAMLSVKQQRKSLNLRIMREATVDEDVDDGREGRVDFYFIFPGQLKYEEAYFAVEAKLLRADDAGLASRYVTHGMARFRDGLYGPKAAHGMMLGIVRQGTVEPIRGAIERSILAHWRVPLVLGSPSPFREALAVHRTIVDRNGRGSQIDLIHVFVDMILDGLS